MLILLFVFLALTLIQVFYYLFVFSGFSFAKPTINPPKKFPVSVIVYCKNHADYVIQLIPQLLQQNYHNFELVLVNQASTDDTLEVIKEFSHLYENIKVVDVTNNENFWLNKKYALTLGIKAAKHEYLLFIDANQRVNTPFWLQQMSSCFTINKNIVLGYSAYPKKKGLFNKFLRFDLLMTQLHQFSWTRIGVPFALHLPNISFKKDLFFSVNGFSTHIQNLDYEYEVLVKEMASNKNTIVCDNVEGAITQPLPKNYSYFFKNKKRDMSFLSKLSFKVKLAIKLFDFSSFFFYISALILGIYSSFWMVVLGIVFFRILLSWIVIAQTSKKFQQKDFFWWYPLLELVYCTHQVYLFICTLGKKY